MDILAIKKYIYIFEKAVRMLGRERNNHMAHVVLLSAEWAGTVMMLGQ